MVFQRIDKLSDLPLPPSPIQQKGRARAPQTERMGRLTGLRDTERVERTGEPLADGLRSRKPHPMYAPRRNHQRGTLGQFAQGAVVVPPYGIERRPQRLRVGCAPREQVTHAHAAVTPMRGQSRCSAEWSGHQPWRLPWMG